MREVYKVVILLDLDLVSNIDGDNDSFQSKVKCLRRTVLNVLTVFSIQHTDLLDQTNDPHFRWGCKFYCSTQKKKVSQKYQFTDFNLEVLKNFEKELEEQCKSRRVEVLAIKAAPTSASDHPGEKAAVLQGDCHAGILGTALKDILCDYPWNELVIDSPVRGAASNTSRLRKLNGSNSVGSVRLEVEEESTKNFVVVISSVPKSAECLRTFLGGDLDKLGSSDFLSSILPNSVRHQFYNVMRINLLWLDLTLTESHNVSSQNSTSVDCPKLIDGALKTVGGGLIPLNSSLEFLLSQGEKWSSCCCTKSTFPKAMECCSPFTSAMSGFLSKSSKENAMEKQINIEHCHSVLHIDGIDNSVTYDLDLMPLFGSSLRINSKLERKEHSCAATYGSDGEMFWFPKNLHTIGTISIHDIHNQLIARPFLFICNGMKEFKNDTTSSFHHLLVELVNQQQALLLSCDHVCQGILFPANSRAKVAMLYILTDGETIASITSKLGDVATSPSAETNAFVKHLLNDWEPSPLPPVSVEGSKTILENQSESIVSPTVPPKILCQVTDLKRSPEEVKLDEKLQLAYQSENDLVNDPVEQSTNSIKDNSLDCVGELNPCETNATDGNPDASIQMATASEKDCQKLTEKEIVKENPCEEDFVETLKSLYDAAIHDGEFLKNAQNMISAVVGYYHDASLNDCPNSMAEKLICQHFLATPSTIAKKYASSSPNSKKTRVNEHFMQSVLSLELLSVLSPALTVDVNEISAHLRMVSFVAGVKEMTTFVRYTVVANYYPKLKEAVTRLCRDLNQPVTYSQHDSSQSDDSETDQASTPEKLDDMLLTDISAPSSVASTCSQSKLKREEKFVRNPSFTSNSSRQILVPAGKLRNLKAGNRKPAVPLRSNPKRGKRNEGNLESSKPKSTEQQQQPTTPQGRHVLKTKKAADTPICKQVDNSVLKRQSLKRKFSDEDVDEECLTVDETPDKNNDWVKKFWVRRSPRMHPCTVERDIPFCAADEDAESQSTVVPETNDIGGGRVSAEVNKISRDNFNREVTPTQTRTNILSVQSNMRTITPERKAKVRRHLNLGSSFSPHEKSGDTSVASAIKLSDDEMFRQNTEGACRRTLRSNSRRSVVTNSESDSVSGIRSENFNEVSMEVSSKPSKTECSRASKRSSVSKRLLQTPLKDDTSSNIANDAMTDSKRSLETELDTTVIASTPTRNGVDSPVALFEDLCLLYGSLTNGLEENLSRSSSPRIPLLFDEEGGVIGDCEMNAIEDVDKMTLQPHTCDTEDPPQIIPQNNSMNVNRDFKSSASTVEFSQTSNPNDKVVLSFENIVESEANERSPTPELTASDFIRRTRSSTKISSSEDMETSSQIGARKRVARKRPGGKSVDNVNKSTEILSTTQDQLVEANPSATRTRRMSSRQLQREVTSTATPTEANNSVKKLFRSCTKKDHNANVQSPRKLTPPEVQPTFGNNKTLTMSSSTISSSNHSPVSDNQTSANDGRRSGKNCPTSISPKNASPTTETIAKSVSVFEALRRTDRNDTQQLNLKSDCEDNDVRKTRSSSKKTSSRIKDIAKMDVLQGLPEPPKSFFAFVDSTIGIEIDDTILFVNRENLIDGHPQLAETRQREVSSTSSAAPSQTSNKELPPVSLHSLVGNQGLTHDNTTKTLSSGPSSQASINVGARNNKGVLPQTNSGRTDLRTLTVRVGLTAVDSWSSEKSGDINKSDKTSRRSVGRTSSDIANNEQNACRKSTRQTKLGANNNVRVTRNSSKLATAQEGELKRFYVKDFTRIDSATRKKLVGVKNDSADCDKKSNQLSSKRNRHPSNAINSKCSVETRDLFKSEFHVSSVLKPTGLSDLGSKSETRHPEHLNVDEMNESLTQEDKLAPQRFTRSASKEIGLTLDAFTEISTIPSEVPLKAVIQLTKRYGTPASPSSQNKSEISDQVTSRSARRFRWKFNKSGRVILGECAKPGSYNKLIQKYTKKRMNADMSLLMTSKDNSEPKQRSAALVKSSVALLRRGRTARVQTRNSVVTRSRVTK